MTEDKPRRRRRANGEESRNRILNAATQIASERGYEGTTIGLVSKLCGLPASSIYWHFADKDELIAAVIERSFAEWADVWTLPPDGEPAERISAMISHVVKAMEESPDFLRLGLMLSLERRPVEPRAREMFLRVREQAHERLCLIMRELVPDIDATTVDAFATMTMATADGLFIAKEIGGDTVDLRAMFELQSRVLSMTAATIVGEASDATSKGREGN